MVATANHKSNRAELLCICNKYVLKCCTSLIQSCIEYTRLQFVLFFFLMFNKISIKENISSDIEHIAVVNIKKQCLLLCDNMHVIWHCFVIAHTYCLLRLCFLPYVRSLNFSPFLVIELLRYIVCTCSTDPGLLRELSTVIFSRR